MSAFFDELRDSLEEGLKHAKGERKDLRTSVLPRPPKLLSGGEIANLRERVNCSQAVFAKYLNVSVKTVQSWEQGLKKPSGATLRLLSIVKERPEILFSEPTPLP
jgi:putative transcriptional regulator